jgi:cytochrome c oxidase subunit 2
VTRPATGRLPEALRIPPQAATAAEMVDAVAIGLTVFSLLVSLAIAAVIVFFVARYHVRRAADRSNPARTVLGLEFAWIIIPVLISLGLFAWSGAVFLRIQRPPRDIEGPTIWVVGKQWMWKFAHEGGREEINTLHVPAGEDIRLSLTSQDVIHSLYLPAFRLKQDVLPGRYTTMWFRATRPGEYHLFCAEYCGEEHSKMRGRLIVMTPADFARWSAGQPTDGADPEIGRAGAPDAPLAIGDPGALGAFWRFGCAACHLPTSAQRAPRLDGLWMRQTRLEGGASILADENYLRESILEPNARITAGYPSPSLMPTYAGLVTEDDLRELIQFIQRLEHGWPPELLQRAGAIDLPTPPQAPAPGQDQPQQPRRQQPQEDPGRR